MGNTADRLRERHPSRSHETLIDRADFTELLTLHIGARSAHVRPDDVRRLMTAVGLAASDEARLRAGHESRKDSLAALRAMLRLPDEALKATLQTCDMVTLGRIRTAHAELDYRRNGIPVVEIPNADLSSDDLGAACNGDTAAYARIVDALNMAAAHSGEADSHLTLRRGIELPTKNQPLHLPLGIDGLKEAIADAITAAEEEAKDAVRGRRELPHQIELAKACAMFWQKCGPRKQPVEKYSCEEYVSPRVKLAMDVFILAGIDDLKPSWVSKLFTGKLLAKASKIPN